MRWGFLRCCAVVLAAACAWPPAVPAQAIARALVVRSPAFVETADGLGAMYSGMQLEPGSRVITGAQSRVVMQLPEGSVVKLGERAQFRIEALAEDAADPGLMRGVLNVLSGAFRFTTEQVASNRRRDFDIRMSSATIGIRGTDVWGRTTPEQDFIVLIEGEVTISRDGEPVVSMTQPRQLYTADQGQPANPLSEISAEALGAAALETEPADGSGLMTPDGSFAVYLASFQDEANAGQFSRQLQALGYPTFQATAIVNDAIWQRVGVDNFATLQDARAFAASLEGTQGITGAFAAERD